MIVMHGSTPTVSLGLDWSEVWKTAKGTVTDIFKSMPGTVVTAAEKTVIEKVTPIAQQVATAKTERVIKKGNVALFLAGGATLGALVAGGSWRRRTVGGIVVGTAATLVGWQIGWLEDRG